MKKIWKFELNLQDIVNIVMPSNAKILSIQVQHGLPCLWALVEDSSLKETRTFITHETGESIDDLNLKEYIGSYQRDNGNLVSHVFELLF